jgi:hypothetical protein
MVNWTSRQWIDVARAVIAVLATLLLASVLSQLQIFREAWLGSTGLSASDAIRFLGHTLALVIVWTVAWRIAGQLPESRPMERLVHRALRPLAILTLLPTAYTLMHPMLSERMASVLSWLLVLPLVGAALWLGLVFYENADALVFTAVAQSRRIHETPNHGMCQRCRSACPSAAKFCGHCGASLDQSAPGQVAGGIAQSADVGVLDRSGIRTGD